MSTGMTHEEIGELLGAYALHATEPDEVAIIEAHLAECPKCRAEVAAHLEVATLLGNSGGDAPDGLWDRIADTLEEAPPPLRLVVSGALCPRSRRLLPVGGHAATGSWWPRWQRRRRS